MGKRVKWEGKGKGGNYEIYILCPCVAKQESKKKELVSSDETKKVGKKHNSGQRD
jgi:hypothetical protein